MKISIIHASRSRPAQALHTFRQWTNNCKESDNLEYILSVDVSDTPENKIAYSSIDATTVSVGNNNTAIEAFNRGSKMATGDLLIAVSDDFNSVPFHWDDYLRKQLAGKSDFIVKTDDGAQPWIITMPMMDRAYYNRFGYIYNPVYKHLFCDTEMTHVADLLGRKISLPIRFLHNHYTTGKTPKDAINIKNDATWAQGEAEYLKGMINNFGLPDHEIKGSLNCDMGHINWLKSKGIDIQIMH